MTGVVVDDTTTGAVEIGVGGGGSTGWIPWNHYNSSAERTIQVDLSEDADITYSMQHTNSDIFALGFIETDALIADDTVITAETASSMFELGLLPAATRFAWSEATDGTMTILIQEGQ